MNKTLTITAIAFVAVAMSTSMIVPALAHDVIGTVPGGRPEVKCPEGFNAISWSIGQHPDHNGNGVVCEKVFQDKFLRTVIVDDLPEKAR